MIPENRLQHLILSKDHEEALKSCNEHRYDEGWMIVDGAMVIYDMSDPPSWLRPVIDSRDDDGNTPSFSGPRPAPGSVIAAEHPSSSRQMLIPGYGGC